MQKMTAVGYHDALRFLKAALPADFTLESESIESGEVRIDPPGSLAPVVVRFVDSVRAGAPGGVVPVRVLNKASSQTHRDLRREGTPFIDLSGSVHLRGGGVFVDRDGLPPVRPVADDESRSRRRLIDPYADRASRVVRVLLSHARSIRWSVSSLAEQADVNVSTASRVGRELVRQELLEDEQPGQGSRSRLFVPDPDALLEDWTRKYSWRDNETLRVAAPVGSTKRFIERLPRLIEASPWALSMQAGASLIAPHADFDIVHIYVESPAAVVSAQGWDPSPAGQVVLMTPKYDESVWFGMTRTRGLPIVSSLQLALDLWHYPVRGREQARHVVETVLRPVWEGK